MRATMVFLATWMAFGLIAVPLLGAGGSPPVSAPSPQAAPKSAEDLANDFYKYGLKHRDKAWKLEDKAKEVSGGQQEKLQAKAQEQYLKAIGRYEDAVSKNPNFYQAHSSLGYALRKTGNFESSLKAYNRALELAPMYAEAIEYRAEAYLGLGRLAEVKDAYMQLFELDRARAEELMAAMNAWVEARRADSAGMDAKAIEAFAQWVGERAELADQSAQLFGHAGRIW